METKIRKSMDLLTPDEEKKKQIYRKFTTHPAPKSHRKPIHHIRKWMLLPAAAALLGISAIADTHFHMFDKVKWNLSRELTEELADSAPSVISSVPETTTIYIAEDADYSVEILELPDPSDLLNVQETLFDGSNLFIYAEATENGKQYDIGALRIYINGVEQGPVEVNWTPENPDEYLFEADLSALNLTEDFDVILPLSVFEKSDPLAEVPSFAAPENYVPPVRYENQELHFTISVSDLANITAAANQTFTYDGIVLEITNISFSATSLKTDFYYHVSEEKLAEFHTEEKAISIPVLKLADGTILSLVSAAFKGPGEGCEDGYFYSCEFAGIPEAETDIIVQTQIVNLQYEDDPENREFTYAEDILELSALN